MVKARSRSSISGLASTPCSRLWNVGANRTGQALNGLTGQADAAEKTSAAATLTVPVARDRHECMRLDSGLTIAASRAWRS